MSYTPSSSRPLVRLADPSDAPVPMPRPRFTSTHTVVELEVSAPAYDEIHDALASAGYGHAFCNGMIDMSGIGLTRKVKAIADVDDPTEQQIKNMRLMDRMQRLHNEQNHPPVRDT
jgi:hypothetical protein